MRVLFAFLMTLALASQVLAADGDVCGATDNCRIQPPAAQVLRGVKDPPIAVQKVCDAKTSAADCGPVYVPVLNAKMIVLKVVRANNAGAACTFDDWGVYEFTTATPNGAAPDVTTTFGALCAIDDDTSTSVVGATAAATCKIFGPLGPYLFIDAGTLGTCSDFSIWAWYYPDNIAGR